MYMCRYTGKKLSLKEHIMQSIDDILTTYVGTRVMRRAYGSKVFEFLGKPINRDFYVEIYAEVVDAIARYEKRITLYQVEMGDMENVEEGHIEVNIYGNIKETKENFAFKVVV